ncbi:ribosome recycling factor [Fusibacter tunisiensis]|uniref:Ribosome-recycling factor n=1 Tax=Fusibacter tunisiensis TaxID=1008308 RepID=A0ABS2MMI8_9FIRM|nr:ribosome recycling factor [Fusibacter tunisiensis]MBM7560618.1 ribosome recycling factor [Fusibacter tunisiensis]
MRNQVHKQLQEKMEKTLSVFKDELNHIRAGRANPLILDKVKVEYYGSETPLKQLASISVPEPRIIQIQPYDGSILKDIEKAIQIADLGINPNNDGKVIRLTIPMLTEERRKELVKDVKKMGEDSKIALRNERRDAIDHLKKMEKSKEITEDELVSGEKEVQKQIDEYVSKVDQLVAKKSDEIMEV